MAVNNLTNNENETLKIKEKSIEKEGNVNNLTPLDIPSVPNGTTKQIKENKPLYNNPLDGKENESVLNGTGKNALDIYKYLQVNL